MQFQNVTIRAIPGAPTFAVWYTLYLTAEEAEERNYRTYITELGTVLTGPDGYQYRVCGRDTTQRELMMHPNGGYFTNCQVMATRIDGPRVYPIGLVGRNIKVRRA